MPFAGLTRELPFVDYLELLRSQRRSCAVHVTDDAFLEGMLYVSNGEPFDATFGELRGEPAVLAMVCRPRLAYEELAIEPASTRTVKTPLPDLLRSAARALERQALPDALHGVPVSRETALPPLSSRPRPRPESTRWLPIAGLALVVATIGGALWFQRPLRSAPDVVLHASETVHGDGAPGGTTLDGAPKVAVAPLARPNVRPSRYMVIKGSDTVGAALGPAWARALEGARPEVRIHVEALGSSTGFAGLLDGTAQVAASSRPARAEEHALAEKLGIRLHAFPVAHDAIAVVVHPDNSLRAADVPAVARAFAGQVDRFDALGGPMLPIRLLGRPSYSGTHAFFREHALSALGKDTPFAPGIAAVESSQEMVERVASDRSALGYVSFGHVNASVRMLALASTPGRRAITPSLESVQSGNYPLSRALYLYLRSDASPDARAFVELALSDAGQALAAEHGFVSLVQGEARALPSVELREGRGRHARRSVVRLYFEPGRYVLSEGMASTLEAMAREIGRHRRAVIVGNADPGGSADEIARVARQRAEAVHARLRALGVDAKKLSIELAAAERPLASNDTAEGRRENGRVDVLIVPDAR